MMDGLFELSALDVIFFVLLIYVVYKLFFKKGDVIEPPIPQITPLKKQDMTVEQLRHYNGVDDEHICLAILGNIYDVTRGKDFYGPEGVYGALAGHDATRSLATMDIKLVKDEHDDISDMTETDLEDARDWAQRLGFKYPVVGRLLAPGETPKNYAEGDEASRGDEKTDKKTE